MPRGARQTSFLNHPAFKPENRREHGGFLRAGKRKIFRPIDPKKALHVVLRSDRARGEWSMLKVRHEKRVKHLAYWAARRHGVRIYRFANSGNHLHLVIYAKSRELGPKEPDFRIGHKLSPVSRSPQKNGSPFRSSRRNSTV